MTAIMILHLDIQCTPRQSEFSRLSLIETTRSGTLKFRSMMSLKVFLKSSLVFLLGFAIVFEGVIWFLRHQAPIEARIRNDVLISIDTCRADHLSCYGGLSQSTPNTDAVAWEGNLFCRRIRPIRSRSRHIALC